MAREISRIGTMVALFSILIVLVSQNLGANTRKAYTAALDTCLEKSRSSGYSTHKTVSLKAGSSLLEDCAFKEAEGGDGDVGQIQDASLTSNRLPLEPVSEHREDFDPAKARWSFDRPAEWSSFAYVDEDSAELVIGLADRRPAAYSKLRDVVEVSGGRIVNTVSDRGSAWALVVDMPLDMVHLFAHVLESTGLAKYAEPNFKVHASFVPNDPDWGLQWGPMKIEADAAWDLQQGGSSVLVAVVDTGIDWNHPDLASNYVALGYDWVNVDSDPMDDNGHGTHCAGVAAAVINNGAGIAGMAQVRVMAEKVLDSGGEGYWDWLASGIIHATDQGAKIISMSLGGYEDNQLARDAVQYAYGAGVLMVAAAGNDATSERSYPAAYDQVVAVTATDQSDAPAWFTNFGDWVEVAAPGVSIWSTVWDDSYTYMDGTSMACPHVSGVAALVWSQFPYMSRDQVRTQLRNTADDLGDPGFDYYYGYGRINARKAVQGGAGTYYVRSHFPNEWISGGIPMGWHADDASWEYTLPFDFLFYGTAFRTVYISSNGLVTFLGPDSSWDNSMAALATKSAIAVAWDDWVTDLPFDIYIWQPDLNHVIIRWEVHAWGSSTLANFEAILGLDGVIQFNYGYNDGPMSATVGISNGLDDILAQDFVNLNYVDTIVFTPGVQYELDVLAYTDDAYVDPASRYPVVALNNLGIAFTHYPDDPSGFAAALTTRHWDLVVVDHALSFEFGNNWVELENYVLSGGRLALSTFEIDGSNSEPTTLWATLGSQWSSDMPSPEPTYQWAPTHPIFNVPNVVGDLAVFEEGYLDDGDHVSATMAGTAIAGFTPTPSGGNAAIVVGGAGKTVLMSFLLCEFRSDEDADGKLDSVELWENIIHWLAPPTAPSHDIAATGVTPWKTVVGQNYTTGIDVAVMNQGDFTETFDVSLSAEPAGLVGYWKFDEGVGSTAHDSSGNGNDGVIHGATWIDGKLEKALNFDSAYDNIEVNDSPSLDLTNQLTIMAWIKPDVLPSYWPRIAEKGGHGPYAYTLGIATGSALLTLENGAGYCEAYCGHPVDEWVHLAGTWDGTTMKIYKNGVLNATSPYAGSITPTTDPLIIGGPGAYDDYFRGTIDEVKIYNRALTSEEVWAAYTFAPTLVGTETVTLESGVSTNVTFTWNTTSFAYGIYTISANATRVAGETNTTNNLCIDGSITVSHVGDVNGDWKIDIQDLSRVEAAYGSARVNDPHDPDYRKYRHPASCPTCPHDPETDLNNDSKVEIQDLARTSGNFGWHI